MPDPIHLLIFHLQISEPEWGDPSRAGFVPDVGVLRLRE
jgi:hypothetical protein